LKLAIGGRSHPTLPSCDHRLLSVLRINQDYKKE